MRCRIGAQHHDSSRRDVACPPVAICGSADLLPVPGGVRCDRGMDVREEQHTQAGPLDVEELAAIDRWWRAANYLSVGQIYLMGNPLLREPLLPEHVKPRLLGHWGTTPGLNFVYAHLNRALARDALSAIYVAGPGHGGPGLVASTWLEGSYSELYPNVSQDEDGMRRLFRQFSSPGGIPSHVAPETPASIHE